MAKQKKGGSRPGNYTEFDFGEKVDEALRGLGAPNKFKPGHAGLGGKWWLGEKLKIPKAANPKQLVGGALIGVVGQRTLGVVTPAVTKLAPGLAVDAINFGVGAIPFAVKQTSLTFGIALPGLFQGVGRLTDLLLEQVNLRGMLAAPAQRRQVGQGNSPEQTAEALREMAGQAQAAQQQAGRRPAFTGRINAA